MFKAVFFFLCWKLAWTLLRLLVGILHLRLLGHGQQHFCLLPSAQLLLFQWYSMWSLFCSLISPCITLLGQESTRLQLVPSSLFPTSETVGQVLWGILLKPLTEEPGGTFYPCCLVYLGHKIYRKFSLKKFSLNSLKSDPFLMFLEWAWGPKWVIISLGIYRLVCLLTHFGTDPSLLSTSPKTSGLISYCIIIFFYFILFI